MASHLQVLSCLETRRKSAVQTRRVARWSRRVFCLQALAWAGLAEAQPAARAYRLGILWHADNREGEGAIYTAVLVGLRERGWVEGHNLVIEHRFAAEQPERFRSLAAELVALKPDALLAMAPIAAVALKNTGTSIPIVFCYASEPVALGLVQSLARPGGTVTGFTLFASDLIPKRLQLLLEALPQARQAGVLYNPDNPMAVRQLELVAVGARANDLAIVPMPARDAAQIDAVIAQLAERGVKAMLTINDPLMWFEHQRIADAALARGIAEQSWFREAVIAGSLFSYGVDLPYVARQSTEYVTRVLKGTSPAELPVVEPNRFELLVNLKTAKALGITIPSTILLRADEVIR